MNDELKPKKMNVSAIIKDHTPDIQDLMLKYNTVGSQPTGNITFGPNTGSTYYSNMPNITSNIGSVSGPSDRITDLEEEIKLLRGAILFLMDDISHLKKEIEREHDNK